ncbi:CatB-related O-acetyltransferase [Polynucleobacter paneuropaeus]|nr:CatB-related O-acetyltransferase [Polynucleobacter paneuropaeus]
MELVLNQRHIDYLHDRIALDADPRAKRLIPGQSIFFDPELVIESGCGFYAGNTFCSMGSFSYSSSNMIPSLKVGRYCSLSWHINWFVGGDHPMGRVTTSPVTYAYGMDISARAVKFHNSTFSNFLPYPDQKPPATIAHDVWIGQGATILPGVELAIGTVVAGMSVVTKSTKPYSVVAGNPATVKKYRFSSDIITGLLATEWWNYNFTDFGSLPMNDPHAFIDSFLERKKSLEPYLAVPVHFSELLSLS